MPFRMAGAAAGRKANMNRLMLHLRNTLKPSRLRVHLAKQFVCNAARCYLRAPIQSPARMTSHEQRLVALARVLMLPNPNDVVRVLRGKNVMYFDRDGSLLFDAGPHWSDERLVEAAAHLFLVDGDDDGSRQSDRAAFRVNARGFWRAPASSLSARPLLTRSPSGPGIAPASPGADPLEQARRRSA